MSIASLTLRVRKNTEQAKPVTLSNETPAWDKVYARPAGHVVKRLDNIPTRQRGRLSHYEQIRNRLFTLLRHPPKSMVETLWRVITLSLACCAAVL
ncbi:MAG: hypothetical protein ABGZ23_23100 [Fuerstiella sp.]